MAYDIDANGAVILGAHEIPVPSTISPEAQEFLRTRPFTILEDPMWHARPLVDAGVAYLNDIARASYPVEIEEAVVAGVRCHKVQCERASNRRHDKVLLNLHGGGWCIGSGQLSEAIPIAHLTGIAVIAVDYRLAPENPFPAAVDDVVAVYGSLLADGCRPDDIGIFGTSAGGFLTAQTAVRLQRENLPLPACLGVFTAGGDFRNFGDTAQIFTLSGFWGDLFLPLDHEHSVIRAYLGGADPSDPLVSPILADLSGFPPTLLISGTRDTLLSETTIFHRALLRAGVLADLVVFEAMPHAHWVAFQLPETREAFNIMSKFFLRHLPES